MADKTATNQTSTLAATVVTKVVTALAESVTTAKNSATSLIKFSVACKEAGLPVTPAAADVSVIVDKLAEKLAWNGTAREKVSKSEARNLVRQHAYLPELQDALRASPYGSCSYHDAVKLCRLMKDEGNVAAAVAAFNTKPKAKAVNHDKRFARALQQYYTAIAKRKKTEQNTARLAKLQALAESFGFDGVANAEASH